MDYTKQVTNLCQEINKLGREERIATINAIKQQLHEISPFKNEPVDCVVWVKADSVHANDYNPNAVAPPEMLLLAHSIDHDGYTQPVVTWQGGEKIEVVDGFHRTRVCKECESVKTRVGGYLPVVSIRENCSDRNDRIASTIRHNRARGKHGVDAMSDIVAELKKRNWSDKRIGKELGMESDEVLRLSQITGLVELFENAEFNNAWEVGDDATDETINFEEEFLLESETATGRVFHTYEKWECFKNNFYSETPPSGMTAEDCEAEFCKLIGNEKEFRKALSVVIGEWKFSCEHYLTNERMNRIAWLGQASVACAKQIPSKYRTGYRLLKKDQQEKADAVALEYLNKWLKANNRPPVSMEDARGKTQQDLY